MELLSLEAKSLRETVFALQRRRATSRNQTLYAAWKIPYLAHTLLRRSLACLFLLSYGVVEVGGDWPALSGQT